jgi:hypothetical protein
VPKAVDTKDEDQTTQSKVETKLAVRSLEVKSAAVLLARVRMITLRGVSEVGRDESLWALRRSGVVG